MLVKTGYILPLHQNIIFACNHLQVITEQSILLTRPDVIKQIKEIKPQVKVFFISASEINYVEVRTELPFVDIDEFIEKPILLYDFITMVSSHIN